MGKTRKCIKCKRIMGPGKEWTPKRKDAKQCIKCRRKQQDKSSHKIKKRKRAIEARKKLEKKVEGSGIKEKLESDWENNLLVCIKDRKNPTKEEFDFLKNQIVYDFEIKNLPKEIQDEHFKKLRETKFKNIFKEFDSDSS
jgi:hypothetical protein